MFPVYFYKRNNIYYYCREVPSDLRHHFNKKKIEESLRTKSKTKAARSGNLNIQMRLLRCTLIKKIFIRSEQEFE